MKTAKQVIAVLFILNIFTFIFRVVSSPICDNYVCVVDSGYDEFQVWVSSRPKHFYVGLLNTRNGFSYKRIYVSKHFNEYKNISNKTKIKLHWEHRLLENNKISAKFYSQEIYRELKTALNENKISN